ncbi:hypothetical protein EVAR_77705_1 [Eumeta japonica]|uniref:Uncharacterized protein n=1 Tax=Eumeta variegata TaxID=151549 RepID=A0A4C1TDS7_EUMVA|nr:hypothetical protein EVAR_77705_1 [Eumeta japonica]
MHDEMPLRFSRGRAKTHAPPEVTAPRAKTRLKERTRVARIPTCSCRAHFTPPLPAELTREKTRPADGCARAPLFMRQPCARAGVRAAQSAVICISHSLYRSEERSDGKKIRMEQNAIFELRDSALRKRIVPRDISVDFVLASILPRVV